MTRFIVSDTPIAGVKVVERTLISDHRGGLSRLFCAEELAAAGWDKPVMQINHAHTKSSGAIRGMHFQHAPHAEMKLVSCVRGRIWDVAVDLRAGSATFMQWFAQELSASNRLAMLIPQGVAHGFQALEGDCEILYLHSSCYQPDAEDGINPFDPALAINWPVEMTDISEKDHSRAFVDQSFTGITP
ncbi:dTDP-4-dehydrorhamnose 3,5-epimerase family protein [Alcanivorax sp. 1008]|uniref:dTDP-4-dehydrorhamnose 3,5-epimerase family protein n=1 Tax=Alcanivorax sp. 1008 TaxID=2816853 RepID=UPI001DFD0E5E|nr:dTDP-4-dehydrorhamnose 3,5-epimerase family protein [Alcanivorax sp. 1008]